MTCWRESQIRRIGEADKMTCKQKRPEKEALSGTSCDRGRYGDGYGDVAATISATSHRCVDSLSLELLTALLYMKRETRRFPYISKWDADGN